jgi:hypothetical protein
MNDKTATVPGKSSIIKTTFVPATSAKLTSHTTADSLEQTKSLLSDKPLRPPVRPQFHA